MGFLDDVFAPFNKSPPQDTPKLHMKGATGVTVSTGPVATKGAPLANVPADSTPASHTPSLNRRWSLQRTLGFLRKVKSSDSEKQDVHTPVAFKAAEVIVNPASQTSSDRQAKESALALHSLIVGHPGDGSDAPHVRISPAQLASVKAQLHNPETAIPIITQLRALPAQVNSASHMSLPIRAVALPFSEEKIANRHFSQQSKVEHPTIESIIEAIKDLHIVSLFTAPDLGPGQPGDGSGLPAGAAPTSSTVVNGVVRIIPQLMGLGFASGKGIIPDHRGVHPPVDRISVVTCTAYFILRFVNIIDIYYQIGGVWSSSYPHQL